MVFALPGAVMAALAACALAACSGADPLAGQPVNAQGSLASAVDSREGELLLPSTAEDRLLPAADGVRVSLAKLTWSEEVAAGTDAGDAPLFDSRGLAIEAENVDGH